jgi:monoamine oxidase
MSPVGQADCSVTTGYDVIIVGAGLSGLTAAHELRGWGHKVLILEATDRIGGRALTFKTDQGQVPIDLGGAWIHGVPTNPLTKIVDLLGFRRAKTRLDDVFYTQKGLASEKDLTLFSKADAAFKDSLSEVAKKRISEETSLEVLCREPGERRSRYPLGESAYCASFRLHRTSDNPMDFLPNRPDFVRFENLLKANAGPLESSAELERTSAVEAAEFQAEDDDLVMEGIGTFVKKYGEGLPVCLNSPVTRVTYGDTGVTVETKNGRSYQGRKALMTVSAGVLRARRIQFVPELPFEKRRAIDHLPMGTMQKVILEFDRDIFTPEVKANSWVLYEDTEKKDVMAFVLKPFEKNVAIGFHGGDLALRFENECRSAHEKAPLSPRAAKCDKNAIEHAKGALRNMFPGAKDTIDTLGNENIYVTRWSLDEWTYGAYSVALPGSWKLREELARPVPYSQGAKDETEHRVYFAGEACAVPMYNGSFAGAYLTGLSAARDMLDDLAQPR